MVVIQENITYFVSSRLHLPHCVMEEEPTATFYQINYVNMNGVKWKLKNTAQLKLLYTAKRSVDLSLQKKWMEPICRCSDCKVGLCNKSCFKLFHTYADF
jgi:hypothetical protein